MADARLMYGVVIDYAIKTGDYKLMKAMSKVSRFMLEHDEGETDIDHWKKADADLAEALKVRADGKKKKYKVVIEGAISEAMETEINDAIKGAVMSQIARLDLRNIKENNGAATVRSIGGTRTDGMWVDIR